MKKNAHVGGDAGEYVRKRMARDPELAKRVQVEFDRLQLARRVRALREARKLSQGQLAELAGTKQPAIARLESGKVVPRLDLLQKIARALGMRLNVNFVSSRRRIRKAS